VLPKRKVSFMEEVEMFSYNNNNKHMYYPKNIRGKESIKADHRMSLDDGTATTHDMSSLLEKSCFMDDDGEDGYDYRECYSSTKVATSSTTRDLDPERVIHLVNHPEFLHRCPSYTSSSSSTSTTSSSTSSDQNSITYVEEDSVVMATSCALWSTALCSMDTPAICDWSRGGGSSGADTGGDDVDVDSAGGGKSDRGVPVCEEEDEEEQSYSPPPGVLLGPRFAASSSSARNASFSTARTNSHGSITDFSTDRTRSSCSRTASSVTTDSNFTTSSFSFAPGVSMTRCRSAQRRGQRQGSSNKNRHREQDDDDNGDDWWWL
jgi:hypothetical protein